MCPVTHCSWATCRYKWKFDTPKRYLDRHVLNYSPDNTTAIKCVVVTAPFLHLSLNSHARAWPGYASAEIPRCMCTGMCRLWYTAGKRSKRVVLPCPLGATAALYNGSVERVGDGSLTGFCACACDRMHGSIYACYQDCSEKPVDERAVARGEVEATRKIGVLEDKSLW